MVLEARTGAKLVGGDNVHWGLGHESIGHSPSLAQHRELAGERWVEPQRRIGR
jgi:hypothetical protein